MGLVDIFYFSRWLTPDGFHRDLMDTHLGILVTNLHTYFHTYQQPVGPTD